MGELALANEGEAICALLSGQLEGSLRNMGLLLELLDIVGTSPRGLEEMLRRFLLKVVRTVGAERGMLLFLEGEGELEVGAAIDVTGKPFEDAERTSKSLPLRAVRERKALCVMDLPPGAKGRNPTSSMRLNKLRSVMCIPLETSQGILGVLYLDSRLSIRVFNKEDLELLQALCRFVALHIENARFWDERRREELARREELEREIAALQESLRGQSMLVGESAAMQRLFAMLPRVAQSEASVLIYGETGTGKESIARLIHELSGRAHKPLIVVDCTTIPENLAESELFGHEKGAFTGAVARKIGKFEMADGGTVFLDEVGELPLKLQGKLLRVLEQQELERVGGGRVIKTDIRVIAATNRNLEQMMRAGEFREDLYYRLHVVRIEVPPLRERERDKILLAEFFLRRFAREYARRIEGFTEAARAALLRHDWPGNVREMKHRVQRAVILAAGPRIDVRDLQLESAGDPAPPALAEARHGERADRATQEPTPVPAGIAATRASPSAPGEPEEAPLAAEHRFWNRLDALLERLVRERLELPEGAAPGENVLARLECYLIDDALARTAGNKTRAGWLIGMERRQIIRRRERLRPFAGDAPPTGTLAALRTELQVLLQRRNLYDPSAVRHENLVEAVQRRLLRIACKAANRDVKRAAHALGVSPPEVRRYVRRLLGVSPRRSGGATSSAR
jgi:transcriptional regulator with GAF, ATPase, and Fis domain